MSIRDVELANEVSGLTLEQRVARLERLNSSRMGPPGKDSTVPGPKGEKGDRGPEGPRGPARIPTEMELLEDQRWEWNVIAESKLRAATKLQGDARNEMLASAAAAQRRSDEYDAKLAGIKP